jgi:hypothetical protein
MTKKSQPAPEANPERGSLGGISKAENPFNTEKERMRYARENLSKDVTNNVILVGEGKGNNARKMTGEFFVGTGFLLCGIYAASLVAMRLAGGKGSPAPMVVALGGAALFANWHKLFPGKQPPKTAGEFTDAGRMISPTGDLAKLKDSYAMRGKDWTTVSERIQADKELQKSMSSGTLSTVQQERLFAGISRDVQERVLELSHNQSDAETFLETLRTAGKSKGVSNVYYAVLEHPSSVKKIFQNAGAMVQGATA